MRLERRRVGGEVLGEGGRGREQRQGEEEVFHGAHFSIGPPKVVPKKSPFFHIGFCSASAIARAMR